MTIAELEGANEEEVNERYERKTEDLGKKSGYE